jgi:hypothetical protein
VRLAIPQNPGGGVGEGDKGSEIIRPYGNLLGDYSSENVPSTALLQHRHTVVPYPLLFVHLPIIETFSCKQNLGTGSHSRASQERDRNPLH